jgi:hypothetical protein
MIMMLRKWQAIARSLLRPANRDPLEESVLSFRVWPGDLDSMFYTVFLIPQVLLMALRPSRAREIWKRRPTMTQNRYLDLEQIAIAYYIWNLRGGSLIQGIREAQGMRGVTGGMVEKYHHGLRLFQKFQVRTRAVWYDQRWFYFQTDFEYEGMTMCTMLRKNLTRNWAGPVPTAEIFKKLDLIPPEMPPLSSLEPELKAMIQALAEEEA